MTQRVLGPSGSRRRRRSLLVPGLLVLMVALAFGVPAAVASHYEASLEGSNFEIDNNANLVNDEGGDFLDWVDVDEARKADAPTGRDDDSYSGGSKEDDACPGTTTGSIPNNKSDLLNFGVYEEEGNPGFLHLFWQRVTEPSGTTLMDFELNQSSTDCGNGVNPVRTADDLLIEYRIEQGGASAVIKVREWTGSAWGPALDLTAAGDATGTINTSAIADDDSDELGAMQARTFGEASIDLDFIFDEDECRSFGSAFIKSRASDSFTSQMKDFIGPQPIALTNCGTVIIHKETEPAGGTGFGFTTDVDTDPAATNSPFSLDDGETETISNVLPGSYEVAEDDPGPTYELSDIDCSESDTAIAPTEDEANLEATFTIAADDTVECTFTNTKLKQESSMDTSPWVYPNDTATVRAASGLTDIDGTVEFKLYGATGAVSAATNCGLNGATGLLYSQTVTLADAAAASKSVSTTNPGGGDAPNTSRKIEADAIVVWRVEYSPDSNHFGRLSSCDEVADINLTADTGGDNVPDE